MPKKAKKELLTNKVGRLFVASLFTSITGTSFCLQEVGKGREQDAEAFALTEFSRIKGVGGGEQRWFVQECILLSIVNLAVYVFLLLWWVANAVGKSLS